MSIYKKVPINLQNYICDKIYLLEEQFKIKLTGEEKRHFFEIKTDAAVDAYARKLIMEKL